MWAEVSAHDIRFAHEAIMDDMSVKYSVSSRGVDFSTVYIYIYINA